MFIFLFLLIVNGLIGSTAVWPQVMLLLLTEVNTTSYEGCLFQFFLVGSYGGCNYTVLTAMAYDRFVSIFQPLQYHTIMTPQKVKQLSFAAYFVPAAFLLGQVCLTTQISLCQYTIHKIFCDKLSIFSLSCGDSIISHVSNVYGIFLLIGFGVLPVFLIFLSYLKIMCYSSRHIDFQKRNINKKWPNCLNKVPKHPLAYLTMETDGCVYMTNCTSWIVQTWMNFGFDLVT